MTKWEFSPAELHVPGGTTKPIGAIIDFTGGRPGTYTTNLIYIVSADIVPADSVLVDLAQLTGDYEAQDGDVLTGTAASSGIHITVVAGAAITLKDATIMSIPNDESRKWAGITPLGDATIILEGTNEVKGGYFSYPGILAAENSTLTIKGTGSLEASSNGYGAGIGGGMSLACGNIVIEGGNITATGGSNEAGIGGGMQASCGTITITGGTVTATGGNRAAGIGSGEAVDIYASCGDITITSGVTSVTATAGGGDWDTTKYSIGAGNNGECGTVTIAPGANVTQN